MQVIKVKSFINSVRSRINIEKNSLLKDSSFLRKIQEKKNSSFGRCQITKQKTAWHRQRGAKRLYRNVFYQDKEKIYIVLNEVYDPNKTNFLSLNFDLKNRKFFYGNSISKITSGALIETKSVLSELKLGFRTVLSNIPAGTIISNISLPGQVQSSYIRAAGTFGQLIQIGVKMSKLKLPSGKVIEISSNSIATLGTNNNDKNNLINLGKAGTNRNKGRRPIVRGIAMNPVDHPHGGRTNGGRPSVSPWGIPTKSKFKLK